MSSKTSPFALYFEPDGYDVTKKRLLGRQSAGLGFLRAAVQHLDPESEYLTGYVPGPDLHEPLEQLVHQHNSALEVRSITAQKTGELKQTGTLYQPDPNIALGAVKRLRSSITDFSITGVTHTTASHRAMGQIRGLATQPIAPWDALICTSQSVKSTVDTILGAEFEYLSWRLGENIRPQMCQTPVIPLGIHTKDFEFDTLQREKARTQLRIETDEIVFLFLGRLHTFMKAHVHPMYAGLQRAAKRTNKKVTMIECGWFSNTSMQTAMEQARQELAPDVKYIHVDGRDPANKEMCWRGADVFVSLSDNIQETFGLTPVEAMAAGLPIIISDWNGYNELCIDGEHGFLVPTTMIDETDVYAHNYELTEDYGRYCSSVAQLTAVDIDYFTQCAEKLILDPTLRQAMGVKGKNHAKITYDWSVVFGRYQELWKKLGDIRQQAASSTSTNGLALNAPKTLPDRQSPSALFEHYPSHLVQTNTRFAVDEHFPAQRYEALSKLDVYKYGGLNLPSSENVEIVLGLLQQGFKTPKEIAEKLNAKPFYIKKMLSVLLKMGLVKSQA